VANVSIGGNVTDSVMVFGNDNYVVKIGDIHGGVVNIIKPSEKPKYAARPTPVTIKPRFFPSLLDRTYEFEAIKKASQLFSPVSLWGPEGIGKTSFIRHLAHILDTANFTSGTIYINASGLGYEDLLQALFDSFFNSDLSYKPTTSSIVQSLQNIKALIFLDNIQVGRDEAASILDAIPNSLFILSSTERSLWGEGEIIPLRGLPESESLNLFEKELSRPLNDQEQATVIKICAVLQGHPLQILQAATLVRDTGKPVENFLIEISNEKAEDKSMAYMNIANLSDSEKRILALLAAAGGNIVSLENLKEIFKGGREHNDIQRLVTLGFVQSHSPRFSITGTLVSSISTAWDLSSWQDTLLNYTINWLSQQPSSALVEESSDLLIHTLKKAGERKKWREVIQLGRLLEKFMVLYKRWQTWSDILNLVLTAAKALNDSSVQAWALHQLGSRALYLGYASEAKAFLSQALNIRQAIGDKAGLALTQHNINTLNGIITPLKGKTSGCRKYLSCGCGAVAAITALTIIIWIFFSFLSSNGNNEYPPTEAPVFNPTDTPSPTISPTSTHTPTSRITKTPSPTFTATSTPQLLYDFVEHADEAYWFNDVTGGTSKNIDFQSLDTSLSPEEYATEYNYNYVGWEYNVALMNGDLQDQVLLTYPYLDYFKIFGNYEKVRIARRAPKAYLEIKAGYKAVFIESTTGVIFRIYIDDNVALEAPYNFGDAPLDIGQEINIPEGIHRFRLEVESQKPSAYDYAAWAVVKLWDKKP